MHDRRGHGREREAVRQHLVPVLRAGALEHEEDGAAAGVEADGELVAREVRELLLHERDLGFPPFDATLYLNNLPDSMVLMTSSMPSRGTGSGILMFLRSRRPPIASDDMAGSTAAQSMSLVLHVILRVFVCEGAAEECLEGRLRALGSSLASQVWGAVWRRREGIGRGEFWPRKPGPA